MIPSPKSIGLYVHLPWCIHKCPYCDFNSHEASFDKVKELERDYFKNLIKDEKEFIFKYSFISSNNLYVVSKNGFIFTINTNNLSNISYKKISKNIASFPIVVSNNIYFLDYNGMIYRLN